MPLELTDEEVVSLRKLLSYVQDKMPDPAPREMPSLLVAPYQAKLKLQLAITRATRRTV